jgi:hypothetical protein
MPEAAEVTQVLQAIGRNEEGAAEKLLPLPPVFAEISSPQDRRTSYPPATTSFPLPAAKFNFRNLLTTV